MSYFSRLRRQSGLTFREDRVPVHRDSAGEAPAAIDEVEVVTLVDPARAGGATSALTSPVAAAPAVQPAPKPPDPATAGAPPPAEIRDRHAGQSGAPEIPAPQALPAVVAIGDPTGTPASQPPVPKTLRQVFEWIAAAPPPPDRDVSDALQLSSAGQEDKTAHPVAPSVGETVAMPARPVPASPRSPDVRPPVRAIKPEQTEIEVLEPLFERKPRAPADVPPSPERASAPASVEETLTVSIGAIHLRVEAAAPPPVTAQRPVPPAPHPRQERSQPRSRLARHYLRP